MENLIHRRSTIDTGQYFVLAPIPPFVDIILQSIAIDRREFSKIVNLAADYQNDPRMIEMVRKGGDASAKVPYLMDTGETADSILATLREIAQPHLEHIQSLPDQVQATIHLLLSINTVPRGCEMYGLSALLEIDRIQGKIVRTLHNLMSSRHLARDFHNNNITALQMLDRDWPRLREGKGSRWPKSSLSLPEQAQMQYEPFFDKADRLIHLNEACVIVDAPDAYKLQWFIPPVFQRPLPANVPVPTTGSADWLIHEVGKIGRHFTRALLEIIKVHLAAEQVALESRNYTLINLHAQDALQEYVDKTP
jgi:hypothetical protein